jgi:glycosyltransferase involved in cell wall biosynthesis
VLSLATYEPRKNLAALVAAFTKIAPSMPDVRLVLVGGSGWKNVELDEAMATSSASDRIIGLGYVDDGDVPALLRRAGVVAYPAFEEGFGLPALEALACGAPLVTSARSAMAEVTGDAALLVEPSDEAALAEALVASLAGGAEVERRRNAGIARAEGYTWRASADAHLEAYRLALEGVSRRSGRSPA